MKKVLKVLLSLLLALSLCACSNGSKEEESEPKSPEEQLEDDQEQLSQVGEVEVEDGVAYVTTTIPKDFLDEEVTQEKLDKNAGKTYSEATLNEDGSVTYKMSKKQYDAKLKEVVSGLEKSLKELVKSKSNNIKEIEHNDEYTEFDITLESDSVGIGEKYMVYVFYVYGGIYQIYTGTKGTITVNYNDTKGNLIESYNSSNIQL